MSLQGRQSKLRVTDDVKDELHHSISKNLKGTRMEVIKILTEKDIFGSDCSSAHRPKPRARGVLVDGDGLIALIYDEGCGYYTIPGGRIEDEENHESAFLREMLEETGCRCEIAAELGCIIQIEQNQAKQDRLYISFCFLARLIGEKGTPTWMDDENDRALRVEWHNLGNAIELVKRAEPTEYSWRFVKERDIAILKAAQVHLLSGE